jgi:signal transduction histidine kinase
VRPEDLSLSWLDPKPSLRGLVGRLRSANRGRARIKLRIDQGVPRIRVDATRMAEALTNLVQNAVEALSERYGEESGSQGVVEISCGLSRDRRDVIIAVEDNGPGIPATSLNEVFRAGFTTKSAGSGLGLAITRRIIADHGGVLEVDGRAGRGARFVVRLALDAEARVSQSSTWMLPVLLVDPEALLVDELA